jgi:phosphoglycolate phosphatase-like HAD superfamily hydrolase
LTRTLEKDRIAAWTALVLTPTFRAMSLKESRIRGLAVVAVALLALGCAKSEVPSHAEPSAGDEAAFDPLPSWNDTVTKAKIIEFVDAVTDPDGPGYVEPAARIATFDNDGTLWVEKPAYAELLFALDRVRSLAQVHPEWKTQEPFRAVIEGDRDTLVAAGTHGLVEVLMASHTGMSASLFQTIASEWIRDARHPELDKPHTELAYQPQIELLRYLEANGFATFIVSGGTVEFLRTFAQPTYGIPPERVIGSSIATRYEVQGGKPSLLRLPEVDFIDDKAGKPVGIHKRIGRKPILAFGNSDGDFEMLQYTTMGSGTSTLGLLLHHDDAEREYAYDRDSEVGKLDRALDAASAAGWVVVSMKDDWMTVFVEE